MKTMYIPVASALRRVRSVLVASLLVAGSMSVGALAARIMNPEFAVEESVYVNVEKNGRPVVGLDERNFRLFQDGRELPFRVVEPEPEVSVTLLVEHSKLSADYRNEINSFLEAFGRKATSGHWYSLVTFSGELEIRADFTKQISAVTAAGAELDAPIWREINTRDAVYESVDRMRHLPGRSILIVIGSGVDTTSDHDMDDLRKKIEGQNVTIYAIGLGSALAKGPAGEGLLRTLARKSGGAAWFPSHPAAFPEAIDGIMQKIATQYRLAYVTDVRGSHRFSALRLESFQNTPTHREGFKVVVRDGWR